MEYDEISGQVKDGRNRTLDDHCAAFNSNDNGLIYYNHFGDRHLPRNQHHAFYIL